MTGSDPPQGPRYRLRKVPTFGAKHRLNRLIPKTLIPSFLTPPASENDQTGSVPEICLLRSSEDGQAPLSSSSGHRNRLHPVRSEAGLRPRASNSNLLSVEQGHQLTRVSSSGELSLTGLTLWASHSSSMYESMVSACSDAIEYAKDRLLGEAESGVAFNDELEVPIRMDPMQALPTELIIEIMSHLDDRTIAKCALVSRRWNHFARSNDVWRTLYHANKWTAVPNIPDDLDWSRLYRARRALEKRWEQAKVTPQALVGHLDSVYCVTFDDTKIVTGSRDRTINVWSARTGRLLRTLGQAKDPSDPSTSVPSPTALCHSGSVLCIALDESIMISGSSDSSCIIWDARKFRPLQRVFRHTQGVLDVAFDKDHIVSCSKDSSICVWDRKDPKYAVKQRFSGHVGPVNAVQISGDMVASAGGDSTVRLWSIKSGQCIREFLGHTRGLACVRFSSCLTRLVTGSNDSTIRIWDLKTGKCLRVLEGHKALVRSIHTFGDKIISGSYDQTIKVWNIDTGKLITDLTGWHGSWIFSARGDCKRIISTSLGIKPVILDFSEGIDRTYLDLIAS